MNSTPSSPSAASFLPSIFSRLSQPNTSSYLPVSSTPTANTSTKSSHFERSKLYLAQSLQSKRFRIIWLTLFGFLTIEIFYLALPSRSLDALKEFDYTSLYPDLTSPSTSPGSEASGANDGGAKAELKLGKGMKWSDFAYTQYVTNSDYLCNSVMLFEILHRLGSKADRVMMYPSQMAVGNGKGSAGRNGDLLFKAREEYGVKLEPIQVQHRDQEPTWADSYTKLLAFNQTKYKRVLNLDSDSTILHPMDELFLLPSAPLAIPRAYWLLPTTTSSSSSNSLSDSTSYLSSQLLLITPSTQEFARIQDAITNAQKDEYDMEIVNKLYKHTAMILPHRKYDLLTGELRRGRGDHKTYLGNEWEEWNVKKVLEEASFLHFSDWPMPKPWISADQKVREDTMPKCVSGGSGEGVKKDDGKKDGEGGKVKNRREDCTERDLWLGFYEDFARRRKRVCGLEHTFRKRDLSGDDLTRGEEKRWWEFDLTAHSNSNVK